MNKLHKNYFSAILLLLNLLLIQSCTKHDVGNDSDNCSDYLALNNLDTSSVFWSQIENSIEYKPILKTAGKYVSCLGCRSNELIVYNLNTGEELWSTPSDHSIHVENNLATTLDYVFYFSHNSYLQYNIETGSLIAEEKNLCITKYYFFQNYLYIISNILDHGINTDRIMKRKLNEPSNWQILYSQKAYSDSFYLKNLVVLENENKQNIIIYEEALSKELRIHRLTALSESNSQTLWNKTVNAIDYWDNSMLVHKDKLIYITRLGFKNIATQDGKEVYNDYIQHNNYNSLKKSGDNLILLSNDLNLFKYNIITNESQWLNIINVDSKITQINYITHGNYMYFVDQFYIYKVHLYESQHSKRYLAPQVNCSNFNNSSIRFNQECNLAFDPNNQTLLVTDLNSLTAVRLKDF